MITLKSDIDVELIQSMGTDLTIAHAAWVSTYKGNRAGTPEEEQEKLPGLIHYLMQHRHGTPFEHAALTFRVTAPIFVWREWHRHRIGFSYNEESARYKQLEPVFYIPPPHRPMYKVEDWKPGRPKFMNMEQFDKSQVDAGQLITPHARERYDVLCSNLRAIYQAGYDAYEHNLREGFDPGLARDCLPVGIYSSCWVTANPRSLMAFLSLRVHEPDAKFVSYPLYEMEVAARKVEELFAQEFPITHAEFVAHGRVGP